MRKSILEWANSATSSKLLHLACAQVHPRMDQLGNLRTRADKLGNLRTPIDCMPLLTPRRGMPEPIKLSIAIPRNSQAHPRMGKLGNLGTRPSTAGN